MLCAFRLGSISLLRGCESQMVILGWSVIDELNSDSACKRASQHVKYRKVHETGSNAHQSTQV